MSSIYLSWQTPDGLEAAAHIGAWDAIDDLASTLPEGSAPELYKLLGGEPTQAAALDIELAGLLSDRLRRDGADIDPDLWSGLTQLLDVVISRPPGRSVLVADTALGRDFDPPYLSDWVTAAKDDWGSWPPQRLQRIKLMQRLQTLLRDVEPSDEDFGDKALELVACLGLLAELPGEW